jgi:hypothetical protein
MTTLCESCFSHRRLSLLHRQLAQAIRTQAVAGIRGQRQAEGFIRTPAIIGQAAGKFGSATGAGEAARGWSFCPNFHESGRFLLRN